MTDDEDDIIPEPEPTEATLKAFGRLMKWHSDHWKGGRFEISADAGYGAGCYSISLKCGPMKIQVTDMDDPDPEAEFLMRMDRVINMALDKAEEYERKQ